MSTLTADQLSACYDLLMQLRRTGPDHFNLDHWAIGPDQHVHHDDVALQDIDPERVPMDACGTTACIAGHIMLCVSDAERSDLLAGLRSDLGFDWQAERTLRDRLARRLGMHANRISCSSPDYDWFMGIWPDWAEEDVERRAYSLWVDAPDDVDSDVIRSIAQFEVLVQTLDELVHGLRLDWWSPLDVEPTDDGVRPIGSGGAS